MLRIKSVSVLLVLAVLIGGVLLSAGTAGAVACPATVAGWAALPTCTDQDKDYTFLGGTIPGTTLFVVTTDSVGSNDIHTVSLDFIPNASNTSFTLSYTVAINAVGPTFGSVAMDTTVPGQGAGTTVSKDIFDAAVAGNLVAQLSSTAGTSDGPDLVPPGLTLLRVDETFNVGAGENDILFDTTNTFTELDVRLPEPASILLMGLGLVGLGLLRRKKSS